VYEEVNIMIPGDVKPMKPVVESEGQVPEVSSREGLVLKLGTEVSGRGRMSKIAEVPDNRIIDYVMLIVKMKRGLKGV
jgi:hypothetical protein